MDEVDKRPRWLQIPRKAGKFVCAEISELLKFVVVRWPNSPLGFWMRTAYWRRKTGIKQIMVWRGANLFDCRWIEFGDNLVVGENVEIVSDGVDGLKVFIGTDVVFARGVYVRSANHRYDDPNQLILGQGHTSRRVHHEGGDYAVIIGSKTWIGANVIVLSGAHIGEGSVIGAGSVVTGEIPPYSIAAGSPARVLSKRK